MSCAGQVLCCLGNRVRILVQPNCESLVFPFAQRPSGDFSGMTRASYSRTHPCDSAEAEQTGTKLSQVQKLPVKRFHPSDLRRPKHSNSGQVMSCVEGGFTLTTLPWLVILPFCVGPLGSVFPDFHTCPFTSGIS